MITDEGSAVTPSELPESARLEPEPVGALTWWLIAIVMAPLLIALIRVLTGLGTGFHAASDNALNELFVRDIGHHPVLLGPYSRDEWSHPGPLFYYVSAIPYRLFGANSTAMLADALLINGVAFGLMIAMAKRWGGLALSVPVVILSGVLISSLPSGFLEDPWNPYVTVLPFGAFLMVAWAATCGDRWAYPVGALLGAFCMQTHIGYAPLVLAMMAWCGWRAWRDRATDGLRGGWWSLAALGVVWLPPLFEQIVHDPGNLRTILHYFRTTTEPSHTIADGARVMAAQFNPVPDWIVGLRGVNPISGQPAAILTTPVPVLLIPFGLAVATALRSGDRRRRRLAAMLLIPLGVGVLALAQTVGSLYEYRLRWVWMLAGLCMAFTVGEIIRFAGHRRRRGARPIVAISVVIALILAGLGIARTTSFEPPDVGETKILTALATAVERHLPHRRGVVILTFTSFTSASYLPGLTLTMERSGIAVRVDDVHVYRVSFGDHRVYNGEPIRARLLLAAGPDIEEVATRPGARLIAYVSHVPRDRRARALRAYRRLVARKVPSIDPRFAKVAKDLAADAVFSLPVSSDSNPTPVRSGS